MSEETTATSQKSALKRFAPLIVLVGLIGLVFAMGWHRYLTLEHIAHNRASLKELISANPVLSIAAYMALYIAVVALSLPGGALLTLTGGFLFGWLWSGSATVVAATIGATIIFVIAKTALGETLADRAGPWLDRLRTGFQEDALSYLLFLRLVPAFPFWLVNLAPALLGVKLRTYVIGTFIGIIPGTFAFAIAGRGLDSVIEAQEAAYTACLERVGAGSGETCNFALDTSALVTTELLIAFGALGIVALIPVVLKKARRKPA